jgi:hypothetical protein
VLGSLFNWQVDNVWGSKQWDSPANCIVSTAQGGGGTFTAGEHNHTYGSDTFGGCYIC